MATKKIEMEQITLDLQKLKEAEKQYILGFIAGLESAKAENEQEPPKASQSGGEIMQPLIAKRTADGQFVTVQEPSAVKLDKKQTENLAKVLLEAMLRKEEVKK